MIRHPFVLFVPLLLLASPAWTASFDCTRASKPDERAICTTPDLSALDSEMGGLWFAYRKVPMLMGSSGARMDDAQAFLARRLACGADAACMRPLYHSRIETLQHGIGQAMKEYARVQNGDPCQK